MTSEVKERIAQIQRGEVPEGYHKTKFGIVPFSWKVKTVGENIEEYRELSNDIDTHPIYSSTRKGLMPQADYYDQREAVQTSLGYKMVPDGYITYRHMSDDDVFFFNQNNIGRTILVSSEYPVFIANENAINVFLLEALNGTARFRYFCRTQKLGGTRTRLYLKNLKTYQLTMPPLEEQQRIAAILATQDRVVKLKERIIFEKQAPEKQLMRELFTGKKRISQFDRPVELYRLGDVCTVIMGQSPDSSNYNDNAEGLPLIQGNADLNLQERRTAPRSFTKQITKTCDVNDIVMSVRAPVGTVALANEVACIGRGVCAIKSHIQNQYIYYYLRYFEDKWFKVVQGSTFDSVNGDEIKKVRIYFPEPEEQNAIANILFAMEREIQLLQKELLEEKQKKKALMQLLLTGVVRVTP